jgi:hypothetical protein
MTDELKPDMPDLSELHDLVYGKPSAPSQSEAEQRATDWYNAFQKVQDFVGFEECDITSGDPADTIINAIKRMRIQSAPSDALTAADYEEVLADHRRLVRELDVALCGEEGAAKQASLCDIVGMVKDRRLKLVSASDVTLSDEQIMGIAHARLSGGNEIEVLAFARECIRLSANAGTVPDETVRAEKYYVDSGLLEGAKDDLERQVLAGLSLFEQSMKHGFSFDRGSKVHLRIMDVLTGAYENVVKRDKPDFWWCDIDPDESGESPHEAMHGYRPRLTPVLLHSSFVGPDKFGVIYEVDDETETALFDTEKEAQEFCDKQRAAPRPASLDDGGN